MGIPCIPTATGRGINEKECDPSKRSQLTCSWQRYHGCTTATIEFVRRQLMSRPAISILFVFYDVRAMDQARRKLERSIDKELFQVRRLDCIQLTNQSAVDFATPRMTLRHKQPTLLVFDSIPIRDVADIHVRYLQAEFTLVNLIRGDAFVHPKRVNLDLSDWSYRKFHLYLILRKVIKDSDLARSVIYYRKL
jgi:hypothetical protein